MITRLTYGLNLVKKKKTHTLLIKNV